MAVKFDDVFEAFEFVSAGQPMENEAYLCLETGSVLYHSDLAGDEEPLPDDIEDSEKYVALPHKNDLDLGSRLAVRFAERSLLEDVDDVHEMFRHRGAYRQFKALLERRGMLQQWYEFEEKSQKEALRQWCGDTGIDIQG